MKPLYFQGVGYQEDHVIRHVFAEFVANGVTNIAFPDGWCRAILKDISYVDKLKAFASEYGVNYSAAHGMWGPDYDIALKDKDARRVLIENHCRMLDILVEFGIKTYTVHPHYDFDNDVRSDEQHRSYCIDTIEKMLPHAEKSGIVIAVENNFTPPCTAERVADLCKYFNSPWVGANYDTGHAHILDPAPGKKFSDIAALEHWKLYPQEFQQHQLETMLPYLVTCHIHDNNGLIDSHMPLGQGSIDWPYVMKSLAKAPRFIEYQSEISIVNAGRSVRTIVESFTPEFMAEGKLA